MRNTNFKAMEQYFWDNYQGQETTLKEACLDVVGTGRDIYDYPRNLQVFPHEEGRMADWFQGLPDPFTPHHTTMILKKLLGSGTLLKMGFHLQEYQK